MQGCCHRRLLLPAPPLLALFNLLLLLPFPLLLLLLLLLLFKMFPAGWDPVCMVRLLLRQPGCSSNACLLERNVDIPWSACAGA